MLRPSQGKSAKIFLKTNVGGILEMFTTGVEAATVGQVSV
jgi:hypothetical protein